MTRRQPREFQQEGLERRPSKKHHFQGRDLLESLDSSPEFHDSFSKQNLFLSKKIRQELCHCSNPKKWSTQLQQELVHRITPEFQKRFPKYNLAASTVKKTWEIVQHYSTQMKKEALTQEGKLNIPFLIKENLKTASKFQNTCRAHPSQYAHQLAVKMGECIAVVDGIRPKLDELTRTIWALQRHMIPKLAPEQSKSPYDQHTKADKLIIKAILEVTAKHPDISQAELVFHVQRRFVQLRTVTSVYSPGQIMKMLTALLADQCHCASQRMEKTLEQIPYPTAKCLKSELALLLIDSPHLSPEEVTEEAFAFFQKATKSLEDLEEEAIEKKIQNWSIQSDMLLRWVRLNEDSALFKEVEKAWNIQTDHNLHTIVSSTYQSFIERYPRLIFCAKHVETRIWIFLKSLWYTRGFTEEVTTYDRFIQWHKHLLRPSNLAPNQLIENIERRCRKMLPLMPFSRTKARTLVFTEKK